MSAEMREMKVCKEWGRDLKWWRSQSVDDRALMMAYEIFTTTCQQYRDEQMEAGRKNKDKGTNPYHAALGNFGIKRPK